MLAVIVPGATGPRRWPLRVLGSRAAAWLGTISYGIYLWHFPALELIERAVLPHPSSASVADLALVWLAVVSAAVILGAASYYLVEQPARRLLRRRESDGRPRRNDETVQPGLDSLNSAGVAADHLA